MNAKRHFHQVVHNMTFAIILMFFVDFGSLFIFKIWKFGFAEICEKKLNYWKLPEASASAEPFLAGCI